MLVDSSMQMSIGTPAPAFTLPNYSNEIANGEVISLHKASGENATVIMFICNHCPYVVHIKSALKSVAAKYEKHAVSFIAINSNDASLYPADSPEKMMLEGYEFPYLYDKSQEVAKQYGAACTPDFYVFDSKLQCYYRGRFDDSNPGNSKDATGSEISQALDSILVGDKAYPYSQIASMGCNIKWIIEK